MSKIAVAATAFSFTALAVVLTGCSADRPMEADEFSQLSKTIEIAPGQDVAIRLPAKSDAGYQWQLAAPLNEKQVKLLGSAFRRGDSSQPGSTGYQVMIFRALGEGNATIRLKYVRPWEQTQTASRTADFTLVIREANTSPISLPFGL